MRYILVRVTALAAGGGCLLNLEKVRIETSRVKSESSMQGVAHLRADCVKFWGDFHTELWNYRFSEGKSLMPNFVEIFADIKIVSCKIITNVKRLIYLTYLLSKVAEVELNDLVCTHFVYLRKIYFPKYGCKYECLIWTVH